MRPAVPTRAALVNAAARDGKGFRRRRRSAQRPHPTSSRPQLPDGCHQRRFGLRYTVKLVQKLIFSIGFARNGITDLDETIGLIYEAALDPALWPDVLKRITSHGRGTGTCLLVLQPRAPQPVDRLF